MTITAEQFMTQPELDEELEVFEQGHLTEWTEVRFQGVDPLVSIAESLRVISQTFQPAELLEAAPVPVVPAQDFDDAMQALADLGAKHDELYALLEEIEALLKPSTSKLANSVRDAITRWRAPEVPGEVEPVPVPNAVEMGAPPPAHDATVEEWRLYANTLGYTEPQVDVMNRSQIRTLLGIEQPAEVTV